MAAENLEQRVSALEQELADLKRKVNKEEDNRPWWEKIYGAFKGDPMYLEAMKYGRQYRESTRPKPRKRQKKNGHS